MNSAGTTRRLWVLPPRRSRLHTTACAARKPGSWGLSGLAGPRSLGGQGVRGGLTGKMSPHLLHQVSLGLCVQITLSARPVLKLGDGHLQTWGVRAPGPGGWGTLEFLGAPGAQQLRSYWNGNPQYSTRSSSRASCRGHVLYSCPPRTPEPPLLTHSSRASGWAGQQVHTRALSREPLRLPRTRGHAPVGTAGCSPCPSHGPAPEC